MSEMLNIGTGAQLRRRTSRRRRQRVLLLVALGIAAITAAVFYLDNSGSVGTTITPAAGTTNGAVASVVTSGLTGGTTSNTGLPVAKVVIAKDYVANATGQNVRIHVAWTNAVSSPLNGHDVIGVGLYYPVTTITSSGTCPNGTNTITDSGTIGNGKVCLKLDQAVTGKNVDTTSSDTYYGLIPLAASLETGYLLPGTSPGTPSTCATDGTNSSSWCLLSGESTANTRTVYVLAQVLNPGGHAPPGQQPSPGQVTFFVRAAKVG